MAKSIRSKIKRKHRAEFRRTIGSVAYQSQMNNVQTKLQQNLEKQTMKSIDRLSETLMTNNNSDPENDSTMAVEVPEASDRGDNRVVEDCRGENKAPVSKRSRRKKNPYRSKNEEKAAESSSATADKRRPRFFCQF